MVRASDLILCLVYYYYVIGRYVYTNEKKRPVVHLCVYYNL